MAHPHISHKILRQISSSYHLSIATLQHISPEQGFTTLALLTSWATSFFAEGAVLSLLQCLAASLVSVHWMRVVILTPTYDHQVCPNIAKCLLGRKTALDGHTHKYTHTKLSSHFKH